MSEQTPTPETDAAMKHMDATPELLKLARKLKRERDEARENAMIVGLERDKFTEQIANLQRHNDNQRIQLVNLQNECALNNNAAQTWDKLTLEAELTQLRKVCDDQHKLITKNDEWHKEYDDYDGGKEWLKNH